jgi:hypothetical protein
VDVKRTIFVLAGFLLLLVVSENQFSHAFGAIPAATFFHSFPAFSSWSVGNVRMTATPRISYQWVGLNFNLPTLAAIPVGDGVAPIDIQLKDASFWVGAVGLEAQLTHRLSLYATGEANAKRNADVVTAEDPLRYYTGLVPYRWDAADVQWWALEGGATFEIVQGSAVFAGLRRDYLSFGLDNPQDPFGVPINFGNRRRAVADLQLKLWIPYIGVRMTGSNCRAAILWSPLANSAMKVPDVFHSRISIFGSRTLTGFEWRYSMFQPGQFLEGQVEYDVSLIRNLFINVWAKGSWLRIRGTGNLDEIRNQLVRLTTFPPIEIFTGLQGEQAATATLSRTLVAIGLSATLQF